MIDRTSFFKALKPSLFSKLSGLQVQGMEAVLDEWESQGYKDIRWLAYVYATIYHETAQTMRPIKEKGGEKYLKSKPYYPYYGRDFVQTTWKHNYETVKSFTGVDVVSNPDLISSLPMAAKVALHFMANGWYTGVGFKKYFNSTTEDPLNARRIINGTDKAATIKGYYNLFLKALKNPQ